MAVSGMASIRLRSGLSGCLLVLGVRLQHEISHAFLCRCVSDGAQQRKAAAITVDRRTDVPGT